jgi:pimeloyl-ACP methyl ester carboxylesterase
MAHRPGPVIRRPTVPRWVSTGLATLALLIATGVVGSTTPAAASPNSSTVGKPTIVLVHGAWADSTSWNDVVPRLHHDGYRTATPDLGLVSLAADVTQIRAVLDSIPGAATGRSDDLGLVFAAAASHVGGITRYAAQFTALIERAARTTTH